MRVVNYFSVKERVINSRVSRKFDDCINLIWKNERLFPFFDRFGFIPTDSKGLCVISEKNHLQLLMKATNVKSVDFCAIPAIYPSDDEWFSNLGKQLAKLNKSVREVKLFLGNDFGLFILIAYLSNLEKINQLEVLHLSEPDDLHQVSKLFELLAHHALHLRNLHFDYPEDDSNRLDVSLKVIGPRLVTLSCAQYMKFNLGSSLQVLETLDKELEEDQLRILSENCPNLRIINGVVRGNMENYSSLKNLSCLQSVSLADFHFDEGLQMLKDFIRTVGQNLVTLSLHNLVRYEKLELWPLIFGLCKKLESLEINACLCIVDTGVDSEFLDGLSQVTQNLHVTLKNSWINGVSASDLTMFASDHNNIKLTLINYTFELRDQYR